MDAPRHFVGPEAIIFFGCNKSCTEQTAFRRMYCRLTETSNLLECLLRSIQSDWVEASTEPKILKTNYGEVVARLWGGVGGICALYGGERGSTDELRIKNIAVVFSGERNTFLNGCNHAYRLTGLSPGT